MKKKLLQIALLALGITSLSAQNFSFEDNDFIGALSSDAAKDWTKTGWTNFDPKNTVYPTVNETTTLAAGTGVIEITSNVVLDASKTYLLSGIVAVKSGGSLTIPAGTVIRGVSDITNNNWAMIVIESGGKIFANGTAAKPVVITSNNAVGSRERGDWAGLVLLGKAVTNAGATQTLEGFNKVTNYLKGVGGVFGGTDDADNSGVLNYLRVEFAGLALDLNKEVNGITFGAVGSGTTVDYVQVSFSNDDSFEWFGGTVNCKHLIAFSGTDDDFDTDNGYRGHNQYGIALRDPKYFDGTWELKSGGSTSEGFECDNDANSSSNLPFTAAVFRNYTMVGPISLDSTYGSSKNNTTKNAFRRGARLRRNCKQSIEKTIFMGYRNFLMIDGAKTWANYGVTTTPQAFRSDSAYFRNNVIVSSAAAQQFSSTSDKTYNGLVEVSTSFKADGTTKDTTVNDGKKVLLDSWIKNAALANIINPVAWGRGTLLVDPQNLTNPDFKLVTVTGLKNETVYDASLGVYPNPVSENATLFISENEESYSLMNTQGTLVKTGVDTKINMNGVDKGLYILKVGKKSTKVVVE